MLVHAAEPELCAPMSLVGRLAEPFHRFVVVQVHAFVVRLVPVVRVHVFVLRLVPVAHLPEDELRLGISSIGRSPKLRQWLRVIL